MNSVAQNLVATMMNSNLGAQKTTSNTSLRDNNGFKNIMEKAYESNGNDEKGLGTVEKTHRRKAYENVSEVAERKEAKNEVEVEATPVDETAEAEEVSTDETLEVVAGGEEDEKSEVISETAMLAVEEMLTNVAEILNMDVSQLTNWLEEQGLGLEDLDQISTLKTLVMDVFELDHLGELLLNQEATETIKSLVQTFSDFDQQWMDEEGMNFSELAVLMKQTPTQEVLVETPIEKSAGSSIDPITLEGDMVETNLEVVDQRSGQETTKEDLSGHQQNSQESQSFGQLMGQKISFEGDMVVSKSFDGTSYRPVSSSEILDQIVTKAVLTMNDDKTSMKLQLSPGYLGKVSVDVTAEQGQVKGSFVVENQAVKEMLESNMVQLKEQLEQNGIKVEKIEVSVGDAGQFSQKEESQAKQQFNRNRRLSKIQGVRGRSEEDLSISSLDAEQSTSNISDYYQESTVEYSA